MVLERLANQKLTRSDARTPQAVVAWLGAVQAQDFPGARWALGLRAADSTDADVLRAFDEGAILRTHVLRPTWHFVTPADIRWLLALTGPRLMAGLAHRHRWLELDARTMARSHAALVRALEGGRFLTRAQAAAVMRRTRIQTTPERVGHLLMVAEFESLICSGPLHDGQCTYALLDERVPPSAAVARDEAVVRLAERYFASHGPATAADFAWWSGLAMRDARIGAEAARPETPPRSRAARGRPSAWLLPAYDEYLVAYKDRSAVLAPHAVDPRDALAPTVLVDGRAVANWRRKAAGGRAMIEVTTRRRLTGAELDAIARAAGRYSGFLGYDVAVAPPLSSRA
jgi:hypothetical protein